MFAFFRVFALAILIASCSPFPGPRKVDWKAEWSKNQTKLKTLAQDILTQGDKKYNAGNNNFPGGFSYPFDEGFYIEKPYYDSTGKIEGKYLTITFYVDRGLLDHYSAFVYSNDPLKTEALDKTVANDGNDFKLEANWYMIND